MMAAMTDRPLVFLIVCAASFMLPGVAHLRLGAARAGLVYLAVVLMLSTVQFGAPFVERPAEAALAVSVAFTLGWVVSLVATRSAVRLVRARSGVHQ
jgi:hypothetical protein